MNENISHAERRISEHKCKTAKSKDPSSGIITGIIFILAGVFIYADNQGYLFTGWFWWLILSMGIVYLIETIIRVTVEQFKKSFHASLIWGTILTTVGISQFYNIENWWPLILVVVGVVVILSSQRNHIKQNA